MDINKLLKQKRLYFDGGYGTLLQKEGLLPGELPEIWNITKPDIIKNIHRKYLDAGCNIIKTNTFGANILKFNGENYPFSLCEIISSAISLAKDAIESISDKKDEKFIALDIGPTGKLLKPLGDLDFEDAVKIFSETVKLGVKYGVDLILIETMNDSFETKAAVLAAKENSTLPVFVTNAYDESGKLMTGASPEAMVALLEGLRVDALGINCSLGPEMMKPTIEKLVKYSSTPVIVNPNAGLPIVKDGKTVFEIGPSEFAKSMKEIARMGASILGGCCGTTPKHIEETIKLTKEIPYTPPLVKNLTVISSYTHCVFFDKKPVIIGERINPTGKPLFKAALKENNIDYILNEGLSQQELGANVLDVNVGLPEIDEEKVLSNTIKELQAVTNLPLQIDTADASAMEKALRIYNGKPLINSVNGKKEVMDKIFPLAAKYGGVIIALTLDENGIPETADGRIKIAEKIICEAQKYGISSCDIIVDPLAMTISSDPMSASVTLECIEKLTMSGIKTSLGVSNVSFGLPKRPIINSTFFTLCLSRGLSAAIINPGSKEMMNSYYGFCAVSNLDEQFKNYIEYASEVQEDIKEKTESAENSDYSSKLKYAILNGLKDEAAKCANELIKEKDALFIINNCIVPALDKIGKDFEEKTVFLPQLLMSAESAKSAFEVIKTVLLKSGENHEKKYKIVLATVKGDIHDIGKNIVKVLLENYDYDVIDLGKDVTPELILKTAQKENARLVGLSALMTTTVPAMEDTIRLLKENYPECKTIVGGAVLTQDYADMIGADHYAKDAMEAVRYAESLK